MKEYKVLKPSLGWSNRIEKLEDFLNTYAKQGWILHSVNNFETYVQVIMERNKNR
ncbi:DUF4177 domain-containing protein [Kordia sp.]|uniref:DUF4177 domain-containing protein n=1 Tax=Kordia sp. TaxID=1965332 RepID=UPI003D2A7DCD